MDRQVALLRRSGIACVGEVPWGTHFCQFYETEQDLLDILATSLPQAEERYE